MRLSWTKILLSAVVAFVVYKMFFAREHMSQSGIGGIAFALIGLSIVGLFAYAGMYNE